MRENIFSISKAARYLGVTPLTLRNWQKKGLIKSFRTPGGHRRFRKITLDKIKGINGTGSRLEESIKKLEEMELGSYRKRSFDRIIMDLRDIADAL